MAVINYERLDTTDVTTTKTLLHESIPLTGTIVSGTYGTFPDDTNVKNYTHGMFQSVYDYPYLSSSANHIFDLTAGFNASSPLSGSTGVTMQSKKINMYNQFSQVLLGYTSSANTIRPFELDLTLDTVGSMEEALFVNFSRLLYKDEIKKGTVSITLGSGSWLDPFSVTKTLTDASASTTGGTADTQGGAYGVLYSSDNVAHGVCFYQAGLCVIATGAFGTIADFNSSSAPVYSYTVGQSLVSASISGSCDAFRHRIQNISFNNTTQIHSTIYFCRIPHNKYNYSANPTYLSQSQIRVKNVASDTPITYVTTIGLYNPNNELLATAKLSEPLRKDPSNEITLRVRLDY
tara:strand:+ start:24 stop:1067 length:1044 start_codon:yes stop_codon:yes gene_type:complete